DDCVDSDWGHQRVISKHLDPPTTIFPTKTLPCLSFLRTSDPSSEQPNRSYHFLHLTYQEYFAARYFVRQWQAKQPLICPVLSNGECQECQEIGTSNGERQECQKIRTSNFLRKHKYTARFDVFWRFVADLFDAEQKGEEFFKAIEDKPRDLLGPTHQRLVMHCLSEASTEMSLRRSLEKRLKEWLLFECKFRVLPRLASEVEFPEGALFDALQESDMKKTILQSLRQRPALPSSIAHRILSWLKDDESPVLKDRGVRSGAVQVLASQSSLSDEPLTAVVALLRDDDRDVRSAALRVLTAQSSLSDKPLTAVITLLRDRNDYWIVRSAALQVLTAQSSLSDELLRDLSLLLESEIAGDLAEAALRRYKEFYSSLLNGPSVGSLLKILLRRSFEEQWSWYIEDGASFVNAPDRVRNAGIDDMRVFKDMVMESWPRGIPLAEEKIWSR
ncbi:hypothetical protein C8A01DRAFT_21045, partial [Parachaetomium inaequale]